MIEDGPTFALSPNLQFLADTERTFFAARVGAGITDLCMNALGYAWRDNAACLSGALDPHAVFIYGDGNATVHGVVLAEAHGSFAPSTNKSVMNRRSRNKYRRQVEPYLAAMSYHGQVIHGYSVAFGSSPKAPGAFLSLSETEIVRPQWTKFFPPSQRPQPSLDQAPPTSIVLAAHRSNFFLMGSDEAVGWIDWAGSPDGPYPEEGAIAFSRIRYAGGHFLVHPSSLWWPGLRPVPREELVKFRRHWRHWRRWLRRTPEFRRSRALHFGCFAMEEKAGTEFLSALTEIICEGGRSIPATLPLPNYAPVGFGLDEGRDGAIRETGDHQHAPFRDGLALLEDPHRGDLVGILEWSPKEGPRQILDPGS